MSKVNLKVNEKEIPLNDLMHSMLVNLIEGYLKSAKNIPEKIDKIAIEIKL
jgi:hypothetical protein